MIIFCKRITVFILLCFFYFPLQSQDKKQLFNAFIDSFENLLTEEGNEELFDFYFNLYDNPINLNSCSFEELNSLNILTADEINKILSFRSRSSPYHSVYELLSVINIDETRFSYLFPFVVVKESKDGIQMNSFELTGGFRKVPGAERKANIIGDLYGLRYKLKSDLGNARIGLALKKEVGEPLHWSLRDQWYGFEHISGFIVIQNIWIFQNITAGNFTIGNGSGLIFGNGRINSKSANPILFGQQPNIGSKPFSSFLENSSFKGLTTTIKIGKVKLTPFVSQRSLNGTKVRGNIHSITESVSINTSNLLKQRSRIQLFETGFSLISSFKKLPIKAGINFISTNFTNETSFKRTYYSRVLPGKNNYAGSIFVTSNFKGVNIWSEWALNNMKSLNLVAGINFSLGHKSDLSLSFRRYTDGFFSLHSNPGSHYSNYSNEEGLYMALELSPKKGLKLSLYSDVVRSDQMRYQVKVPSNLFDSRMSLTYNIDKKHQLSIWLRKQSKMSSEDISLPILPYHYLRQSEYSIQFSAGESFTTKTRIGIKTSALEEIRNAGSFIYQQFSFKSERLNLLGRISLFEVDDYENRFYVYENDLSYNFRTTLMYRTGYRLFLICKLKIIRALKLEAKWSMVSYFNTESITTNVYSLDNHSRHEIAIQAILKI